MTDYHEQAELAPRDVVASAIVKEMRKNGVEHVYLSMQHLDGAYLKKRFANVYEACLAQGVDLTKDPIPVAPAAHYTVGGVSTGRFAGSTIWGLFACGEVACTGVHGANRLASNSLLECLVFGKRAVDGALTIEDEPAFKASFLNDHMLARAGDHVDSDRVGELRKRVARLMTDCVGIIRTGSDLKRAKAELDAIEQEHRMLLEHWDGRPLHRMVQVCQLAAESALMRAETRGAHIREDCPEESHKFDGHITLKKGGGAKIVQWI